MRSPMTEVEIEARYQGLFGRAAGYLPRDRSAVDAWQAALVRRVDALKDVRHAPSVEALAKLLEEHPDLRELVTRTIKEALRLNPGGIQNIEQMLGALDEITRTAPSYRLDPRQRIYFPMSTLFCYLMAVECGWDLFRDERFNRALVAILKEWCDFLDSEDSVGVVRKGRDGWLCQAAYEEFKLYEFEIDWSDEHGGFRSYNDFFHRPIRPACRPNGKLRDPRAIVSANDGSVSNVYWNVRMSDDIFDIKNQRYALEMLLGHYPEKNVFAGGNVLQSFLSGANYHRWHAPVDGVVEYTELVEGLTFSELPSKEVDKTAGTLSQGYQANVNTRGIVVIDSTSPRIGKVCVVPVGITEISSVTIEVEPGSEVNRGDEIGYFSFGGSTMCLLFEQDRVDLTVPFGEQGAVTDNGAPIFVNAKIAVPRQP